MNKRKIYSGQKIICKNTYWLLENYLSVDFKTEET